MTQIDQADVRAALTELLVRVYRSLPMYLASIGRWAHEADEQATCTLRLIAADQQALSNRIALLICQRYGRAETGGFPMSYTGLHDLSLDYLLRQLVEAQRQDVRAIERLVDRFPGDAQARALAQEALGAAQGHLETLSELAAGAAAR